MSTQVIFLQPARPSMEMEDLELKQQNIEELYYNQQKLQQENNQKQQQKLSFNIGKKIGSGKTSEVFECEINNQIYALKNYKTQEKECYLKFMRNEVNALQELAHQNIVEFFFQANENRLVLENCKNGEVFDYIAAASDKFPQELSRFYAMQLCHAVAYIHQKGFAHLDIKLENCLFDDEFNLKLADFGFATKNAVNYRHQKYIGTHRYMAPELEYSIPYDIEKADIFALGCVIFILELGFQPIYQKAVDDDKYYQFFAYGQQKKFWNWLQKQFAKQINPYFIDLINKMLQRDPSKRINMEQVLNHPYFTGPIYDREQRVRFMSSVRQLVLQQAQQ